MQEKTEWTEIIEPKRSIFDLRLGELWRYRDLIMLFVRRDFVSVYKQTILGPLWLIINPLLTTITYIFVFNKLAKLSTDGIPPLLFYISGLTIWNYFSDCFTKTSNIFLSNAYIFGKVYFPRLSIPVSIIISNLIKLGIQTILLIIIILYYEFKDIYNIHISFNYIIIPFILLILAIFGLGLGIIFSSLTTKYRDLLFIITFGIQILLYSTPIVYPLSSTSGIVKKILSFNPLTPVFESFRSIIFNVNEINYIGLLYSFTISFLILTIGLLIFNKVEKSFMDTV